MEQYLQHAKLILSDVYSGYKPNRTGIDTISRYGHQNEYDLEKGFPLLTTKKVHLKSIIHELIWFLRGDTNIRYLAQHDVHIWDGNAFDHYVKKQALQDKLPLYSSQWQQAKQEFIERIKEDEEFAMQHGNLGDVYGAQWRHWKTTDGKEIDQLADVVDLLQHKPQSRRIIVTAWNPQDVPAMALPPCHTFYQLNVLDGKVDLQLYQRSCDMFLGVPFNLASYSMLLQVLAQQANLKPGRFIHTFGDAHFYCGAKERGQFYGDNLQQLKNKVTGVVTRNGFADILDWITQNAPKEMLAGKEIEQDVHSQDHVTAILTQLLREPKQLPKMNITNKRFDELVFEDFSLQGYEPHPVIRRAMAV